MHSFKAAVSVAVAALAMVAQAETYSIDPNKVSLSNRQSWCQAQTTSCPLLCLQLPGESATTTANDCDPNTLSYNCVCGSGQSPNASEYSQTIPFFQCQEYGNECVAGCAGDSACANSCREDHPCGAQNPTRLNKTSSSATPSKTADSDGKVFNGLSGSSDKSGSRAALDLAQSYGLLVIATGLFAGFGLVM